MKNLILLTFLLMPMFGLAQIYKPYPDTVISNYWLIQSDTLPEQKKPKLISFSKNDAWVMGCFFGYGFVKGWADQIEYHSFEMRQQFPGLFKNNNHFFDGRYDNDGIWDAKHLAAGLQAAFMTASVCIKFYDLKHRPKKLKFIPVCIDILKYDFSRRLGFFISYNVINKNKLFK